MTGMAEPLAADDREYAEGYCLEAASDPRLVEIIRKMLKLLEAYSSAKPSTGSLMPSLEDLDQMAKSSSREWFDDTSWDDLK